MNKREILERAIELKECAEKFESVTFLDSDVEFFQHVVEIVKTATNENLKVFEKDSNSMCNAAEKVTSRTVFKNITESKINVIKNELDGLTRTEWKYIRDGIDMYFRYKAANIKIDDHVCLDNYLNRKY